MRGLDSACQAKTDASVMPKPLKSVMALVMTTINYRYLTTVRMPTREASFQITLGTRIAQNITIHQLFMASGVCWIRSSAGQQFSRVD